LIIFSFSKQDNEKAKSSKKHSMSLVLPNGKIVTGRETDLLSPTASLIVNAMKVVTKIPDDIDLLSKSLLEPVLELRKNSLTDYSTTLNLQEVLITLSICAVTNPVVQKALNNLEKLKGCDVHATYIVNNGDLKTLKSLKVNDEEIKLEDNIFTYTKIVENNIDKLNIEAIPNSTTSTVEIENNDLLEYGENEIIITITAEDKTECKYLLIVTRNQEPSKDNTIKRLEIKNYKLEFNPNILDYNLTIYNEDSLTIKLELNSPLATYEIIGNENLEDDSLIQIKVISESNDERIYTIKIKKDKTKEKLLITLSTALIVLILLALLIFVINKMIKFIKKHKEIN